MTLNDIFRKLGGFTPPTFFTTVNIIGELINKKGGHVTIIQPPFFTHPIEWRSGWVKRFRIGRLYLYISNCRLKRRPIRDLVYSRGKDRLLENKEKLYERHGGICPHCGQHFEKNQMDLHHILPVSRFPELGRSIKNCILLCRPCHKEVHMNPYKNIKMMEAKAKEFDVNLNERFDTSDI